MRVCCICGKPYEGHGNNARPVDWGDCCDLCNVTVVIPRRQLDAKKALATGCDGRCCCDDGTEQEQRELNPRPRDSNDPSAAHCKFYKEQ